MPDLRPLILAARSGDVAAFGRLVECTQAMVYAVCRRVLGGDADAADATQDAFVRAFRRLDELDDPAAFAGWLRRIAINTARNHARRTRRTFVALEIRDDVPVLDEAETHWSEGQRQALAYALLKLSEADRRLCDRYYHGGWTTARLAADAGVSEPAIRKRLQRLRDLLRKEIQMQEQTNVPVPGGLPAKIVELLARPNLVDLPENPVGRMAEMLLARYPGCRRVSVPETIDLAAARRMLGGDVPSYIAGNAYDVAANQVLRAVLDIPMLLAHPDVGPPARLAAVGPVYRDATPGPLHEQAFHQLEVLVLDKRAALDPWAFMGQTLHVLGDLLPGRATVIEPFAFPACSAAWEIGVMVNDKPVSVLAWGVYTDRVVRHLGGDPAMHTAFGVGYGLERMAAVHFGYDDIRKLPASTVGTGMA